MRGGIKTLPPSILQDILTMGRLEAVDLASLEASSSMFRAPSGNILDGFKSITEAAAHYYCETHPVFENLPACARLELLARCEGSWKLVLHFLNSLQRSSGRSTDASPGNNVLTAAGMSHSLMVNGKGELYACGKGGAVLGWDSALPKTVEAPRLISLPATATRIVQIAASYEHAAFVTETGQVYTFGKNASGCCGMGLGLKRVPTPTLVSALQNIPCQQVSTGKGYTMAITRAGEVYSWGCNMYGQLGHGDTRTEFRPRLIEQFDGSDPVVQVSAGQCHTLAVTKSGQLFSWGFGDNFCLGHDNIVNELQPQRVEHGGFDGLFIVSAAAGDSHSAAIDSCGRVYTWGLGYLSDVGNNVAAHLIERSDDGMDEPIPVLVASLKNSRAVQVVATRRNTLVLLDNGTFYCFGRVVRGMPFQGLPTPPWGMKPPWSYVIVGHKPHSIACGTQHALVVTKKGAIFGLGYNFVNQLGVVNAGAKKTDLVLVNTPVQVFTGVVRGVMVERTL